MRTAYATAACAWIMAAGSACALADAFSSVAPRPAGAYPVGCSNVAQNFALAPRDEDRAGYWEGTAIGGQARYVTQLLSEPQGALIFNVNVPDVRTLYTGFAGQQVPVAAIVCYPTSAGNARPDYAYDAALAKFVPRMQRGNEPPLWADDRARYPVLLYSHGLSGSPLSREYLQTIALFASYGYVVVAPFHGDRRFADESMDSLSDLAHFLLGEGFRRAVEMQAIRPLSLQAALDALLAHPDYREHVDAGQVAGFGISLGAESLLLFSGAELTTDILPSLRSTQVMRDARLRAISGYVPYFGQRLLPAFGDDQGGVDGMTVPFLAIAGTADEIAPLTLVEQGVNRMRGARYVVAFDGLTHTLRPADMPEIVTWTLALFDAYVHDGAAARVRIARMDEVSGGAADAVRIGYTPLAAPPTTQATYTIAAGVLPAEAVQVSVTGSFESAGLKLTLDIAKALPTAPAPAPGALAGNVYIVALVPGAALGLASPALYFKPRAPGSWELLVQAIAPHLENAAQIAVNNQVVIEILANNDISALAGTEIYLGYGASDAEMLTANRYRGVYKAQ